MEMVRLSGQQGVPVISAGSDVIVGFDQVRLARLAKLYSAKRRPAFGVLGADAEGYLQRHPEAARGAPIGTKGVYVGKVRSGSIAERAGIQPGDIITGFAGKRVSGVYGLDKLIDMFEVGQSASARVLRDGEPITVQVDFVSPSA
jgi:S1-C subfamily serine protease